MKIYSNSIIEKIIKQKELVGYAYNVTHNTILNAGELHVYTKVHRIQLLLLSISNRVIDIINSL